MKREAAIKMKIKEEKLTDSWTKSTTAHDNSGIFP